MQISANVLGTEVFTRPLYTLVTWCWFQPKLNFSRRLLRELMRRPLSWWNGIARSGVMTSQAAPLVQRSNFQLL